MRHLLKLILLLLAFAPSPRRASAQAPEQLLAQARAARDAGQFARAAQLTRRHLAQQPTDAGARWLLAQLLYWQHDVEGALAQYDSARALLPADGALAFDYAKTLYEVQRYRRALRILEPLRRSHPNDPALADLESSIRLAQAPILTAVLTYEHDNQPRSAYIVETTWASPLTDRLAGELGARPRLLESAGDRSPRIDLYAGVRGQAGLSFNARAGGSMAESRVRPLLAAQARYRGALVGLQHQPYEYTLASTDSLVMFTALEAGFDASAAPRWAGALRGRVERFADANRITTAYGWILAPVTAGLRAGLASAWQDSDEIRWLPAGNPRPGQTAGGRYSPYYTPRNSVVHSLIVGAAFGTGRRLLLDGAVGLYARDQAPFLAGRAGGDIIGFSDRRYTPYRLDLTYLAQPLPAGLRFNAGFQRTAFYTAGHASLTLQPRLRRHARS